MAVVHAGWHEDLDRPVAVKVPAAHLAGDPEFRARFMREARIASRLQHPNLVRVFDITELDGRPAIVMELVEGGTLAGGRLSAAEAASVADGLAHAHARGVVHRDLKPANLLRAADGTVKLADFGIARAAEDTRLTQVGTILGTARYLAPEQAEGRDVGPPADVYSLAVVLDELLAEQPPAVRRALSRARSRDPELRPTAAELAALLDDRTAVAATRILPRRRSPVRLGPALAAAAILASVVIAVAVAARGEGNGQQPVRVRPVAHSDDAAQQARNLAAWLRRYSGK